MSRKASRPQRSPRRRAGRAVAPEKKGILVFSLVVEAQEMVGRRRYLMPQDLFGLREGFGFISCAGQGRPIPTYLPPYWHIEKLARRARSDPYHLSDAAE
jgi:hypothetical protein